MPRLESAARLLILVGGIALGCGSESGLSVDAARGTAGTGGAEAPGMSGGAGGGQAASGSTGAGGMSGSGGADSFGMTGQAGVGSVPVQSIAVSAIVGAVPMCEPDFAHPNVCCRVGGCIEHPNEPFAPCDDSWLTFPNRGRCCPLDGMASCIDVPVVDGGTGTGPGVCSLPCGPEGHSSSGTNFATCGNTTSQLPCVYCCSGSGCTANECNCPAAGPGSPPCACNTLSCGACPDGWQVPAAQVDLCCRTGDGGSAECFSQSVAVSFVEGFSSSSGPSGCDEYRAMGGHVSEITCSATKTPACMCTVDGVMTAPAANGCDLSSCGGQP